MNKVQQGFTLLELMTIVAIIGILTAIALPNYQNYSVKTKLVEETTFLDSQKNTLADLWATNKAFPLTADPIISTATPLNTKYIGLVSYNATSTSGPVSIVLTLSSTGNTTVDGKFLSFVGTGNPDGSVSWTCATQASATGISLTAAQTELYPYLPVSCQN